MIRKFALSKVWGVAASFVIIESAIFAGDYSFLGLSTDDVVCEVTSVTEEIIVVEDTQSKKTIKLPTNAQYVYHYYVLDSSGNPVDKITQQIPNDMQELLEIRVGDCLLYNRRRSHIYHILAYGKENDIARLSFGVDGGINSYNDSSLDSEIRYDVDVEISSKSPLMVRYGAERREYKLSLKVEIPGIVSFSSCQYHLPSVAAFVYNPEKVEKLLVIGREYSLGSCIVGNNTISSAGSMLIYPKLDKEAVRKWLNACVGKNIQSKEFTIVSVNPLLVSAENAKQYSLDFAPSPAMKDVEGLPIIDPSTAFESGKAVFITGRINEVEKKLCVSSLQYRGNSREFFKVVVKPSTNGDRAITVPVFITDYY